MNIFICYRSNDGDFLRLYFEDCRVYLHNNGELGVSFDSSCLFGREEINYRIPFNQISSYEVLSEDYDFTQFIEYDGKSDGFTYFNGRLV